MEICMNESYVTCAFAKNNNEANSLPQNEAISNQPLMEVSVQKIIHH